MSLAPWLTRRFVDSDARSSTQTGPPSQAHERSTPTGRERDSVPMSGQPDAIWYNPPRRLLYVAIGSPGVVDVIDAVAMRRCQVVAMRRCQQVVTEQGAHTTAFEALRQRLAVFLPVTCRAAIHQDA